MSDIFNMSELSPVLLQVAQIMSKLRIYDLRLSTLASGTQAKVSAQTTDGQFHYVVMNTYDNIQWVNKDTGEKSE